MKFICSMLGSFLENMAYLLGGERGCVLIWGDTELPECLRNDLEKRTEEEKK